MEPDTGLVLGVMVTLIVAIFGALFAAFYVGEKSGRDKEILKGQEEIAKKTEEYIKEQGKIDEEFNETESLLTGHIVRMRNHLLKDNDLPQAGKTGDHGSPGKEG